MRSHAKASTAGSTRRQGKLVALPLTLVAALAALMVLSAPASAEKVHLFKETFGSFAQPSFLSPRGLAVDQSSGDLLVIDGTAGTVSRYNPDGSPADFSALGSNVIDGVGMGDETPQGGLSFGANSEIQIAVDNSGGVTDGDIYVTQRGNSLVDVFGEDGAYLGQLTESSEGPFSSPCGVTVGPDGEVYVGDSNANRVYKFAPTANPPVNGDSVANFETSTPCNVAAGTGPTAGSIFVLAFEAAASKLDSSTGALQYVVAESVNNLASLDPSTGHLYLAQGSDVVEYDASGATSATKFTSTSIPGDVNGIAVDETSGNIYVSSGGSPTIEVFTKAVAVPGVNTGAASPVANHGATLNGTVNPEGLALEECFFEYGTSDSYGEKADCVESPGSIGSGGNPVPVHADVSGLSSSTEYHFRLVAKNENGSQQGADHTFTTKGPLIHGEFSVPNDTSATLEAVIDPQGEDTGYHFEYVTQAQFEVSEFAGASIVPVPDAQIGAGSGDVAVSQQPTGLAPLSTYHFRVVATNASGTEKGSDSTFITYPLSLAGLPNSRAYEQVTPVDKNGTDAAWGAADLNQASTNGDAFTFFNPLGIPGGSGGQDFPVYRAARGNDAWSTQSLMPPSSQYGPFARVVGWTPDLAYTLALANFVGQGKSLYLRKSSDGSLQKIVGPPAAIGEEIRFAGASADDSKIFLELGQVLTVDAAPAAAPGKPNLYVWDRDTGKLRLAGVLPDSACASPPCTPPGGSFAGPFAWFAGTTATTLATGGVAANYLTEAKHAVTADDGSAFFTAGATGQIYLRKHAAGPNAETVQVSASQRTDCAGDPTCGGNDEPDLEPDPNGTKPAIFMAATPDGSKVLFTTCQKLTDDSTAVSTAAPNRCDQGGQGQDLYLYDTASGSLTDITVDHEPTDPRGAAVKAVVGVSDDGSYAYFLANGVLAPGATEGECFGSGNFASGECNLYRWHDGTTTFITRLSFSEDSDNWRPQGSTPIAGGTASYQGRVSGNGTTLLLSTTRQLTPYDNKGVMELYRYRDGDPDPTCVSCNPTGIAPVVGGTTMRSIEPIFLRPPNISGRVIRNLSADGNHVFFESPERLASGDTNGENGCPLVGQQGYRSCQDVYEWEAEGSGSCTAAVAVNGGCIYLLSTGKSSSPSFFGDASVSGEDAFIFTRSQLVGQDTDQLVDVYDARVGGGLASQNQPPPPLPCEGEACKPGQSAPPGSESAGSATFSGPGDPPPARKVHRHRRKVHKHHRQKRRANHDRRAHR